MGVDECWRTSATTSSTLLAGVCDRLMRKRSTPLASSPWMTSGRNDDGPNVHRIFVFTDVSFECHATAAEVGVAEQRPTIAERVAEPPPRELTGDDRGDHERGEERGVDDAGIEGH